MEGDVITMQEIFVFEKMGITQDGKVIGRFRATGVRPKMLRAAEDVGHPPAGRHVRRRDGGPLMVSGDPRVHPRSAGTIVGGYAAVTVLPGAAGEAPSSTSGCATVSLGASRRSTATAETTVIQRDHAGPLPGARPHVGWSGTWLVASDRAVGRTARRRARSCSMSDRRRRCPGLVTAPDL